MWVEHYTPQHLGQRIARCPDPVSGRMQAKAEERLHEIERMVDEACSRQAFDNASTQGRQLRPLHVIDGGQHQLARVRQNRNLRPRAGCATRPERSLFGNTRKPYTSCSSCSSATAPPLQLPAAWGVGDRVITR